jgi:hypothetical protein
VLQTFASTAPDAVAAETLASLPQWFLPFFVQWVGFCWENGEVWVQAALDADTIVRVTSSAAQSSSVTDVMTIINRFWATFRRLHVESWVAADVDLADMLTTQLCECTCKLLIRYADSMVAKATESGHFEAADDDDKFDVSAKTCIVVNDLQCVIDMIGSASISEVSGRACMRPAPFF